MNDKDQLNRQIELLIDNELSSELTTSLLAQCEREPELWRTLALGLLQARELRLQLQELFNQEPDDETSASAKQPTETIPRSIWYPMVTCMAVIAFFVGMIVPRSSQSDQDRSTAVGQVPDGIDDDDADFFDPVVIPQDGLAVVGYAQILHRVGKEAPVPVIAGANLDYSTLLTQEQVLPESILRQYRNEGLVVENHRRVMSLELTNGQRFAIPLDQLGVRYVGNQLL